MTRRRSKRLRNQFSEIRQPAQVSLRFTPKTQQFHNSGDAITFGGSEIRARGRCHMRFRCLRVVKRVY